MTASSLQAALRAAAEGLCALEAATELIIGQASWLDRGDFARFIHRGAGTGRHRLGSRGYRTRRGRAAANCENPDNSTPVIKQLTRT